jgi:hypothetical protein
MGCLHDDGMNDRLDDGLNDAYDEGADRAGCHENSGACGEESLTTFGRKYTRGKKGKYLRWLARSW